MKRVVVTGVGLATPIGVGARPFWEALCAGLDGAGAVCAFDASEFPDARAAEVRDMSALTFPGRKSIWALSRGMKLGFAAARLALEDAGISVSDANRDDIGVAYGSTLSGLAPLAHFDQASLREGPRLADPLVFPSTGASAPACQVSIVLGVDAFNTTLSNGQTASLDAVQYGVHFIHLGRASVVLAGGVEDLCRERYLAFQAKELLTTSAARPFDARRDGILLGEGGAVLVLEELGHALERGAIVHAEVSGYGACFAPRLGVKSGIEAARGAMQAALESASMDASAIGAVFANGNGSRRGDLVEARALGEVFAGAVPPVTAVKSMLGESYSAAGAIQSAAAVLSLEHQTLPGTLHYARPDRRCPLPSLARDTAAVPLSAVMVNTFGCTGNCASLVLRAYED